MNLSPFVETAHLLCDAVGGLVVNAWNRDIEATVKADGSLLTATDLRVEERMREMLADRHPDHDILGEEYGLDRRGSAFTWVIDPIDGTRQYAARLMNFGVLVALCVDGVPVIGVIDQPLASIRCFGASGMGTHLNGRRVRCRSGTALSGSTVALANPDSFTDDLRPAYDELRSRAAVKVFDGGCISYMALAAGAVDVCLNGGDLDPFDICALVPVVHEAGGRLAGWDGRTPTIDYAGPIYAAATQPLAEEVQAVIATSVGAVVSDRL